MNSLNLLASFAILYFHDDSGTTKALVQFDGFLYPVTVEWYKNSTDQGVVELGFACLQPTGGTGGIITLENNDTDVFLASDPDHFPMDTPTTQPMAAALLRAFLNQVFDQNLQQRFLQFLLAIRVHLRNQGYTDWADAPLFLRNGRVYPTPNPRLFRASQQEEPFACSVEQELTPFATIALADQRMTFYDDRFTLDRPGRYGYLHEVTVILPVAPTSAHALLAALGPEGAYDVVRLDQRGT